MPLVLAHRGSVAPARRVRENTIEAFELAAELGADGVELDVRLTADGQLVLHHDALVPPETEAEPGGGERSPGVRIETANRADLPGWIPTLEEALAACLAAGMLVNVEVKSEPEGPSRDPDERCATAAALTCAAAGAGGRIVLSSFSIPALAAARAGGGAGLGLAWLCEPRTGVGEGGDIARVSWPAIAEGLEGRGGLAALGHLALDGLHPYYRLADVGFVGSAHVRGLAVRTWTVDKPERIAAAAANGVDAVITNDVIGARQVLGRS
ncbi:MAG: glycerophosphodiester phosphodiesterase [Acidimicrobiales bacterium]